MSWDRNRPILDKLPKVSESWAGNDLVDTLTAYWDDLLVSHRDQLSNPVDWLGNPDQISEGYIDWVAIGLCGLGGIWSTAYDLSVKRNLIRNHPAILRYRGSVTSCEALVRCWGDDIGVSSYADQPRAGIALAGATVCGSIDPTLYHIIVPNRIPRNGSVWYQLEDVRGKFLPIGNSLSRVQYRSQAGLSIAGDAVTGQVSLNYDELP